MDRCVGCGTSIAADARFCSGCGLPVKAETAESRRLVTVLFSDLVDSTGLGERLDPEALRSLLDRYFAAMSPILVRHGGLLEKYIGDAIVAVFGLPSQREDDALRAVAAAMEMKRTLAALRPELTDSFGVVVRARTGIESGEVSGGTTNWGQRLVTGDTVNVAARLQGLGEPDEIIVGPETARLVRQQVRLSPRPPAQLKGKREPVPVWCVDGLEARPLGSSRAGDLVGRDHEMRAVEAAFDDVVSSGRSGSVLVVAEAGMGKSRLIDEVQHRLAGRAGLLHGRCLSYGTSTWWPLAETVRQAAGIDDDHTLADVSDRLTPLVAHDPESDRLAGRLAALLGMDAPVGLVAELHLAYRVMLEGLSRNRPLVVVMEDLHWADSAVLEALVDTASKTAGPVLVVASARPPFPGATDWPETAAAHRRLELRPVSEADARRMVEACLGGPVSDRLADRLMERAEGNPLFLLQLASALADEGGVTRDGNGVWRLSPGGRDLELPTSVRAVIGARLERLEPDDRTILEGASVAGLVFEEAGAAVLAPPPLRTEVPTRLGQLADRELVRPTDDMSLGDIAWRFGHALIRDTAYANTTKRTRAELHARYADWLIEIAGDRLGEVEEVVGHHLADAWRCRVELQPGADHGALAARAVVHLSRSGRRAFDRGDMPSAIRLLTEAWDLLPPGDHDRLALVPTLGKALLESTRWSELEQLLATVEQEAVEAGNREAGAHALVLRGYLAVWSGTAADPDAAGEAAEAAVPVFAAAGDHRGMARVELLLAEVAWMRSRMVEASDHWKAAARWALLSGDRWEISETTALTLAVDFVTEVHVDDLMAHIRRIVEQSAGDPVLVFRGKGWLARLTCLRDGPDAGRVEMAEAAASASRLGLPIWMAELDRELARLELQAGDAEEARRLVSPYLHDAGAEQSYWWRQMMAVAAASAAMRGTVDEAVVLLERSDLLDSVDVQARLESAAYIVDTLVRCGDPRALAVAQSMAEESERVGAEPATWAAIRSALARAHLAAGDPGAAWRAANEAAGMFERLGMTWSAAAALAVIEEAPGSGPSS